MNDLAADIGMELAKKYYHSGLYRPRDLPGIQEQIRQQCSDSAEVIARLEQTLARLTALVDASGKLAAKGIARDSLELNDLKQQIKKLAGPEFYGALYQKYDSCLAANPLQQGNADRDTEREIIASDSGCLQPFPDVPPQLLRHQALLEEYVIKSFWDDDTKADAVMKVRLALSQKLPDNMALEKTLAAIDQWLVPACAFLQTYKAALKNSEQSSELGRMEAEAEKCSRLLHNQMIRTKSGQYVQSMKSQVLKEYGAPRMQNPCVRPPAAAQSWIPAALHFDQQRALDYAPHQNDICGLKPASSWTLLMDESGHDFDITGDGIIAGVLMSDGNKLPAIIPSLHAATDIDPLAIRRGDQALQDILDRQGDCGVLALPVKALRASGDWIGAIGSFIDLVLRMLPLDKQQKTKTRLTIKIEKRGNYVNAQDFSYIRDACRYRLMHMLPEREKMLSFDLQPMTKTDGFDSYPDLVSNTCFAKNELSKKRLKVTNWKDTCFLKTKSEGISNALDYYFTSRQLPAEDWANLLPNCNVDKSCNIVDALLDMLGWEVSKNKQAWLRYLSYTIDHLDSKAINLRVLGKQVQWLAKYQPPEQELPPRLKLTWLTVKLAEANHRGVVNAYSIQEFKELGERLFKEDAPLVCWASLHLAVQYTNAFDFEKAAEAIAGWEAIPPEVPGLKYYGQMLSTKGQHLAFTGRLTEAREYFKQAIKAFSELSDPTEAEGNINQTRAYLLTVMMDLPETDHTQIDQEMHAYFGMPILEAAESFAADASDGKKYQHHILLRFLAIRPGHPAAAAYLARQEEWSEGCGHPWPLILFYRAMLIQTESTRLELLQKAIRLIDDDHPGITLAFIKTVLAGAHYACNQAAKEEFVACLEAVRPKLPMLQDAFISLDEHLAHPVAPMKLLVKTLPFNFR